MINLVVAVASDAHSYAVAQGDDTLAGQTDIEPSDLVNTTDSLVGLRHRELLILAQTHTAALAAYGTATDQGPQGKPRAADAAHASQLTPESLNTQTARARLSVTLGQPWKVVQRVFATATGVVALQYWR